MTKGFTMVVDKKLRHSKKALVLGVALLNLNLVLLWVGLKSNVSIDVANHVITSIITLVGLYLGAQGGQDMITANKLNAIIAESEPTTDSSTTPTPTPTTTPTLTPTPTS